MTLGTYSRLTKTHKTLLIICLFTILGAITLLIQNVAEEARYNKAKLYNTAIHAQTSDSFNYAVDSQQGNILTYGTFTTVDPVTHQDLHNEYFSVNKIEEEYTQHIEYYECGTEESPQTCTRTYYTWDYNGSNKTTASKLSFHNREYSASLFSIPYSRTLNCDSIKLECKRGYVYENNDWFANEGDIRWYYRVTDTNFSGSIFIDTKYGNFKPVEGNLIAISPKTVEQQIKNANSTTDITIFIIVLFIINLIICIVLFKENVYDELSSNRYR
jgi:hypothetical protein